MKKLILLSLLVALVFTSSLVNAQQRYPLGIGNLAVKVDYLRFTDGDVEDINAENAVYVGLEGYMSVFHPNFYLGMESGWAGSSGDFDAFVIPPGVFADVDVDIDYVPIELNAKYVFEINPCMNFAVGAGISANYINVDMDINQLGLSGDEDDWLFGGQFFADFNIFFTPNFFVGINAKYQITDDIEVNDVDTDINASNVRVGGQIGFAF